MIFFLQLDGNADWTKPNSIQIEPNRARQRAGREWKYKLKMEM